MKISLQDFAYDKCRELIQNGTLEPGRLYSEAALSKDLNISRTPLRGAVQRLEKEGLVTRLPQRGFSVTEFTQKDIEELFNVRKAIEGYAAEFLAVNRNRFHPDTYKQHIAHQKKVVNSDNYRLFLDADRIFHEAMVTALNNKKMQGIYGELRQSIALFAIKRFKISRQRDQALSEHQAIIQAIEKGDPTAARQAVYEHIDSVLDLLSQQDI